MKQVRQTLGGLGLTLFAGVSALMVQGQLSRARMGRGQACVRLDAPGAARRSSEARLTGDVVWACEAIVHLSEEVTVEAGSTLTLEPGTVVELGPGASLRVEGRLEALGTEERPVRFVSASGARDSTASSGGVVLAGAGDCGTLEHVLVELPGAPVGLELSGCDDRTIIEDVAIRKAAVGLRVTEGQADLVRVSIAQATSVGLEVLEGSGVRAQPVWVADAAVGISVHGTESKPSRALLANATWTPSVGETHRVTGDASLGIWSSRGFEGELGLGAERLWVGRCDPEVPDLEAGGDERLEPSCTLEEPVRWPVAGFDGAFDPRARRWDAWALARR